ncbi:MAG: hypothetical protein Q8N77_01530, partial [Nanoarchaeota archaeon]|nr:hypothetical protein [Nanoarchaeota archaeon]
IEEMQRIAKQKGGKCLSKKYSNSHTKLRWQCKQGHVWEAIPLHIKRNHWCPVCAGVAKLSIEEMRNLAKRRKGKCLSPKYVNQKTNLKWQCKQGHVWKAMPLNVKKGTWCPICAGKVKLSIGDMQKIAHSRGGKCLSKEYRGNKTKLKWQCQKGHTWNAKPDQIKHGTWCPICASRVKLSIEEMKELAKSRDGKCLSKKYTNNLTKLKWQCQKGHTWEAIPANVKCKGQWCPVCAGKVKLPIGDMQKIAQSRGGKCLSKKYVNTRTKLKWQCKNKHIWQAVPYSIKIGGWCPVCSSNISERICRKYFEIIFKEKFPKARPEWLVNSKGKLMELDGYCKKLKLAFEYQGQQHYEPLKFFYYSKKRFNKRIKDDKSKRVLCKQNNVTLIEVPFSVKYEKMKDFIIKKCKERNIKVPKLTLDISHELFDIYSPEMLKEMKNLAKNKSGECLSKKYISSDTKLIWQCKNRHIWEAKPSKIKQGRWCPVCAGKVKLSIGDMQKMAQSRGGKCLSKKYVNARTNLIWQCKEEHTWKARPYNIKLGKWCPVCARITGGLSRRLSIEEMKKLAKNRGGECLSTDYINSKTKLRWRCKKNHVWEAIPSSIKRGLWCPVCGGTKKLSISEMIKLAKKRKGMCLSKKYIDNKTKLKWQCRKGHIWTATPNNIKNNSEWCPTCSKNRKV